MKILCIDTSSTLCNVGILDNETLLDKIELNNGLTHSETLIPLIKQILDRNSITLNNINLIVTNIGPGSFTGIRIGIATAKAFTDSLNIPSIGINALEVLAYNIKDDGLICSTIDCKNNNCYFSLYKLFDNCYTILEEPSFKSIDEVLNLLNSKYPNTPISFVGNGIPNKSSNNHLSVQNLGIAGYKKFITNNKLGENILPMYLKKPQAQEQLEKKLKNNI